MPFWRQTTGAYAKLGGQDENLDLAFWITENWNWCVPLLYYTGDSGPQKNLLGLEDHEIHYMNQGLHLMIEEFGEIDATEIAQVLRDEKKCLYLRNQEAYCSIYYEDKWLFWLESNDN